MKLLLLGYPQCKLLDYLNKHYLVTQTEEKIKLEDTINFDFIISFGYKHIISKNITEHFKNKIVNLHISYLPYNKGYHPNFWSFIDNTPKGVTIHLINDKIDDGEILIQKEVQFSKNEDTLLKTYNRLIEEIQDLFIQNCYNILNQKLKPFPQQGKGTFYFQKDIDNYLYLLNNQWNTKINYIMKNKKMTDLEIIDKIEKVRSKNNVNWMDVLRLAFTYAPNEARAIMAKINKDDSCISDLLKELSNNDK